MDANSHLANSAYVNFMSHTRMGFFTSLGLTHAQMKEYDIAPVVFYEHIYYFRELFPGPPVQVSLELKGLAEDGRFFEFHHNFYDQKGRNLAHCEMMGAWIGMNSRKLCPLPEAVLRLFDQVERAADFKWLTSEDTRRFGKRPKDLV